MELLKTEPYYYAMFLNKNQTLAITTETNFYSQIIHPKHGKKVVLNCLVNKNKELKKSWDEETYTLSLIKSNIKPIDIHTITQMSVFEKYYIQKQQIDWHNSQDISEINQLITMNKEKLIKQENIKNDINDNDFEL